MFKFLSGEAPKYRQADDKQHDAHPKTQLHGPDGIKALPIIIADAGHKKYADHGHDDEGRFGEGADHISTFPQTAKEIACLWQEAFPAALISHLYSSSFRINAAVLCLCLLCDLQAGAWLLGGYCFVLLSHLVIGVHAFCTSPMRRQQGLLVRSSLETDEVFQHLTRFAARRLSIALLAAAFLLPDWQTAGAGPTLIRILELSGHILLAVGGTMAIVSATHPVTWQELFDSETGAFTGGRS